MSNGLELLAHEALQKSYDIVLTTSMVDSLTIRSVFPDLGKKWIVYFHENQFAYPSKKYKPFDINLVLRDVKRARIAESVAFNSEFNRDSFLAGLRKLIKMTPGGFGEEVLEDIKAKSIILPVGLDDGWFINRPKERKPGPVRLLWNHRWEFDKGPEALLELVRELTNSEVAFELYLAGQNFRNSPEAFSTIKNDYGSCLRQFGKVESFDEYRKMVSLCDAVLSTALHEFQGLAVLEAVASGCTAFAPNRLVYPEYLPTNSLYENVVELAQTLSDIDLESLNTIDVERYKWSEVINDYRRWLS